jgi:hypothetical protein
MGGWGKYVTLKRRVLSEIHGVAHPEHRSSFISRLRNEGHLNYIKKVTSFITENPLLLHYKDKAV